MPLSHLTFTICVVLLLIMYILEMSSNPLERQLTWDLVIFSCSRKMASDSNICSNDFSSSSLNLDKSSLVKRTTSDKTLLVQEPLPPPIMESVFSQVVRPVDLRGIFTLDGISTTGPESLPLLQRTYPHIEL